MLELEVYVVEIWDGGDRHNFGFRLSKKEDADAWVAKHPHDFVRKETLIIFDSLEEQADNETIKLRQRIWDKLSPIERKAIGMLDRP